MDKFNSSGEELSHKERIEVLRYTVSRFDGYFQGVNSKISLFITLSTFILTVSSAGATLILKQYGTGDRVPLLFVLLIVLAAGLALIFTIKAAIPYLGNDQTSIFHFGYVANQSREDYNNKIDSLTSESIVKDISNQAFTLAKGLRVKYSYLTVAGWLLFADAVLIIILSLITIVNIQQ